MTAASDRQSSAPGRWRLVRDRLRTAVLTPVRAMRLRYLPLLMIYYAYGALGLVTIAEAFWIKEALALTPAELAAIAVWLTLPWTIKMVFGQLVDSVPILGSERRAYVYIGAGMLTVDGKEVANQKIPHTIPYLMTIDETFDVGIDTRTSVGDKDYQVPFTLHGKVEKLSVQLN